MNSSQSRLYTAVTIDISALLRGWRCIALFVLYGVAAGLAHYLYYSAAFDRHSTFQLANEFGDLIEQLVTAGKYEVCKEWTFPGWGYRCFVAHRLPAVPLFLAAIGQISDSLLLAGLVKNAVFFAFSGAAVAIAFRGIRPVPLYIVLPLILFWLMPYNVFTAASLEFEEGYVMHLLAAALVGVALMERRSDLALAAAALFLMVLSKSTLTALCFFLAAWGAYRATTQIRSLGAVVLIAASVIVPSLVWGGFVHYATGRAAWGADISTWNGWHLYKANHPKLFTVYPRYSPDYLDLTEPSGAETVSADEWALQDYYKTQGLAMIESDLPGFLRGAAKKATIALFEVRETAGQYGETQRINVSVLVDRLLLYGLAGALLVLAIRRRAPQSLIRAVPCVFSVGIATALYIAPYVVGFAYHRHVIPLIWALLIIGSSALARLHSRSASGKNDSRSFVGLRTP